MAQYDLSFASFDLKWDCFRCHILYESINSRSIRKKYWRDRCLVNRRMASVFRNSRLLFSLLLKNGVTFFIFFFRKFFVISKFGFPFFLVLRECLRFVDVCSGKLSVDYLFRTDSNVWFITLQCWRLSSRAFCNVSGTSAVHHKVSCNLLFAWQDIVAGDAYLGITGWVHF